LAIGHIDIAATMRASMSYSAVKLLEDPLPEDRLIAEAVSKKS
jgi:hypothetical protein